MSGNGGDKEMVEAISGAVDELVGKIHGRDSIDVNVTIVKSGTDWTSMIMGLIVFSPIWGLLLGWAIWLFNYSSGGLLR